jgi:nucleoside-diphosphate kinase
MVTHNMNQPSASEPADHDAPGEIILDVTGDEKRSLTSRIFCSVSPPGAGPGADGCRQDVLSDAPGRAEPTTRQPTQKEPDMQRTLSIINPTGLAQPHRGHPKMIQTAACASCHEDDPHVQGPGRGFYHVHKPGRFFADLTAFMSSGPVVVSILRARGHREIPHAHGATKPANAEGHHPQALPLDIEKNSVHGPDAPGDRGLRGPPTSFPPGIVADGPRRRLHRHGNMGSPSSRTAPLGEVDLVAATLTRPNWQSLPLPRAMAVPKIPWMRRPADYVVLCVKPSTCASA